jgi:ribose transport system permease protein
VSDSTEGGHEHSDVEAASPRHQGSAARRILARYGLLFGLLALIVIFAALKPDAFASVENFKSTATIAAPLLILAAGLTVPLSMNEFDLAISAATQLWAAVMISLISVLGLQWGLSFGATLVCGAVTGTLIGILVVRSKVNAFIITLGIGTVMAGLEFAIARGTTLYENIPDTYTSIGVGELGGVPTAVLVAGGFALVIWVLMEKTVYGRRMRAVGGNMEAARLCGVRVDALRALGFTITGVAAVVAALIITAQSSSYYPGSALAMLLPAYAACFLGTTVFRSNIFDIGGTVVGVAFLAVLQNGLLILGVPSWTGQVAQGTVLVVAVVAARLAAGSTR